MKLINENPEIPAGKKESINGCKLVELDINGKKELHYIHKDTLLKLKNINTDKVEKKLDFIFEEKVDKDEPIIEERPKRKKKK